MAPVVRKGEPTLSSPGRCPAGAAVTHGPGGWGQRRSLHPVPAWSQGLGWEGAGLPNLSIGGLCRDSVVLYPGTCGVGGCQHPLV